MKSVKGVANAGAGSFCGISVVPMVAAQMITDLDLFAVFDILKRKAAVANKFSAALEQYGPQSVAGFRIARKLPADKFADFIPRERMRIVDHSFRVAENRQKGVGIVQGELTQD